MSAVNFGREWRLFYRPKGMNVSNDDRLVKIKQPLTKMLAVLNVELYIWLISFSSRTLENRVTRPCLSIKLQIIKVKS